MSKSLTSSAADRKKVLENNQAVKEIYNHIGFRGVMVDGKFRYTKNQIAQFFEVDTRTIERLLVQDADELSDNGCIDPLILGQMWL